MHQVDGFEDFDRSDAELAGASGTGRPRTALRADDGMPNGFGRLVDAYDADADDRAIRTSMSLSWLVGVLGFLLLMIHVVPLAVERMRYAWVRGEQRAEYDAAGEALRTVRFDELSRAFRLVSQRVRPSVVQIRCEQPFATPATRVPSSPFHFPRRQSDQGSGVVVDRGGFILTNAHVVRDASRIEVRLADGRKLKAQVVGEDDETDLAVLKVEAGDLIAATWADSDGIDVGAPVWAVGSPFGLESSITFGIVSAKHRAGKAGRPYQDFLQTDAAVNPGNSGGPLVDSNGRIVGINTAILGDAYQGVSFAVPSNVARRVYERIREEGYVRRGWLGVRPADMTEALARELDMEPVRGAIVVSVVPHTKGRPSPAEQAGIEPRDVITRWGDRDVTSAADLFSAVADTEVGAVVDVVVVRNGQKLILPVHVGERPRGEP